MAQGGWRKQLPSEARWDLERKLLPIIRAVLTTACGGFRLLVTVDVDGVNPLPVLIVGVVDAKHGDAHCTCVLNPNQSLLGTTKAGEQCAPVAGVQYPKPPKIAVGNCDVWWDMLVSDTSRGRAHAPLYSLTPAKKARFEVK